MHHIISAQVTGCAAPCAFYSFNANTAMFGGAIAEQCASREACPRATVRASTFTNNEAANGGGGALYWNALPFTISCAAGQATASPTAIATAAPTAASASAARCVGP